MDPPISILILPARHHHRQRRFYSCSCRVSLCFRSLGLVILEWDRSVSIYVSPSSLPPNPFTYRLSAVSSGLRSARIFIFAPRQKLDGERRRRRATTHDDGRCMPMLLVAKGNHQFKPKQAGAMAALSSILHVLAIFMLFCQLSCSYAFCPAPAARPPPALIISKVGPSDVRNASASLHGNIRHSRTRVAALSIGAEGDEGVPINNDEVEKKPSRPPFPLVLWRFTRPHTIIGSAIAIPSIFLLAAPTYQSFFTLRSFSSLIYAAVPSLFMNLYITGLNQITDVEIDKINVSAP